MIKNEVSKMLDLTVETQIENVLFFGSDCKVIELEYSQISEDVNINIISIKL